MIIQTYKKHFITPENRIIFIKDFKHYEVAEYLLNQGSFLDKDFLKYKIREKKTLEIYKKYFKVFTGESEEVAEAFLIQLLGYHSISSGTKHLVIGTASSEPYKLFYEDIKEHGNVIMSIKPALKYDEKTDTFKEIDKDIEREKMDIVRKEKLAPYLVYKKNIVRSS